MATQFKDLEEKYNAKSEQYYGFHRNEMLPFVPESAKMILDVGCSSGAFGANLKAKRPGVTVWGVEPFEEAAKKAEEVLDAVFVTTFDDNSPELKGSNFDCIIFNDVLEHLVNPGQAIQTCRNHLLKDGCIVASIPNILYYPVFFNEIIRKEDWKYTNAGTLDNTHLRFFTKKSIIRMFEEAGFEIVKIKGINAQASRIYRVLNLFLFNKIYNWRFLQFAVVARPKNNN